MKELIYGTVWVYPDKPDKFDPSSIEVVPDFSSLDDVKTYCKTVRPYGRVPRVVELEVIGFKD